MFGRSLRIFKLLGFEVKIDASWLIVAALIVWSLAVAFFPDRVRGLPPADYWWMGLAGAFGLFGSVVFHELAHSLVARRYGLVMKGITLFIFGGVAEMPEEPRSARVEFLMAIAGPVSSIVLGFVFYAIASAARVAWPVAVVAVIAYLAYINWALAAFNLIPAFPLDGGRVFRAALWHFKGDLRRATRIASRFGAAFGMLLMILGVYQLFVGNFVGAVWWFLIGMFIRQASTVSYEQVVIRTALDGVPVRQLMRTDPITVEPTLPLRELVDDYLYRYHYRVFPVVDRLGILRGCVGVDQVKKVPREEWPRHTAGDIMQACSWRNTVRPDTDASAVLAMLSQTGAAYVMVVEDDRVIGVVSSRALVRFISTRLELEGDEAATVDRTFRAGG